MDDWPRDPEDQGRSWDGAQPPRSGNLPQPPRDADLSGRLNDGDLSGRLNPEGGRPSRPSQPRRGVPPGTGNRLPRPSADSVRGRLPDDLPDDLRDTDPGPTRRSPANPNATRRVPGSPAPRRDDPNATRRAAGDPNATRRVPEDPNATRRVSNESGATRRVPPGQRSGPRPGQRPPGPRDRDRADDAGPTRMVRAEPADDLFDRDDDRPRSGGGGGGRPPRMSKGARVALNIGKVLVALAAVVALGATGVSWATLQSAESGVTTDNVIDPGGSSDNDQKHSDGADDILLVGLDSRTDVQGNPLPADVLASLDAGADGGEVDTDTMILMHIPDNGGPAIGISIPRDSWVTIPGYGQNRVNAAYADAKATSTKQLKAQGDTDTADVERKSSQAGAKELITVLQNLTGVHIDHYAEVNLFGFDQLSQAIGGVPVCLNHAVKDDRSGANFQAGYFSVQGVQALQFVRQRHNIPGGSTDLQREARQQAFLASMAHKVLSAGTLTSPTELQNMISAIQKSIIIDSGWNLVDFATKMAGMSSGNLKFETIPTVNIDYWPSGKVNVGPNVIQVNPAQIAAFVQGETGHAPPPNNVGATSGPATSTSSASSSKATVDVQNGSGVHNLAANVLSKLTKAGFGQGTTGNIANRTSSVIYFHAGEQDAANAVAAALGGKITVAESPSVPSGHVWVYLGSHYSSEGVSSADASWSITGVNQSLVPQAFTPAHLADPSSITDSGDAPPCVD